MRATGRGRPRVPFRFRDGPGLPARAGHRGGPGRRELDYLAPEQIEGRAADGRADLYSLACTGFEFLCGAPPFGPDQGQTLMYAQIYADPPAASARRAGIPAAVDSVLATALAKDPADRYPSCGRFAEELRAALGLRPGEPAEPPRSPAPRGNGPSAGPRPASRPVRGGSATVPNSGQTGPGAEDSAAALPNRPAGDRRSRHRRSDRPRRALRTPATRAAPARAAARRIRARGPVPGGRRRGRRGRRGRIRCRPVGAISPRPPGRGLRHRQAAPPSPSLSSPSAASSPSAPVTAAQQAAALGTLLTSSAAARTALHNAVTQVGACANLPGAVSQLQDVVNQRAGRVWPRLGPGHRRPARTARR